MLSQVKEARIIYKDYTSDYKGILLMGNSGGGKMVAMRLVIVWDE